MRIVYLETFVNLVAASFLSEHDRVANKSDLIYEDLIELSYVGDFEFCLQSQNSSIL
jgi:hypothetical protein